MKYEILITRSAENDLVSTSDYIKHIILNPKAADELLNAVEMLMESLSQLPGRYPVVDDPVLKMLGIRIAPVKNYILFYTVNNERHQVIIVRFLFGKRNWKSVLRNDFMSNE